MVRVARRLQRVVVPAPGKRSRLVSVRVRKGSRRPKRIAARRNSVALAELLLAHGQVREFCCVDDSVAPRILVATT